MEDRLASLLVHSAELELVVGHLVMPCLEGNTDLE